MNSIKNPVGQFDQTDQSDPLLDPLSEPISTNAEHFSGIVTLNPYYVWYQCSSGNVTSMTYSIEETSDSSPDTPNFGTKLLTTRNTTSDFKPNGGFVVYGLDQQEQKEFLDYVLEKSFSRTWNGTISCNLPVESCKIGPVTPSSKPQIFCISTRNPNYSTNNKLFISIDFTSLTSKGTSVQSSQMTLVIVSLMVFYYLTIFSF
ncbi:hypothetical protein F8M41_012753 [Gigaspora margarita]|uniref:Uncharacterized protein n=1 Tax=Gigaspora margarita TaxID=4874 RepID=A0A8H4A0T6_GIGMA|nr:hypothetical protein F8M41_012753 [Gigaspora margarita]